MGTRSVVAVPTASGWRGRYVHWDGYPTGVGEAVRQIVARDGYRLAVEVLTDQFHGWSSLDPETKEGPSNLGSERSVLVAGYGEAYSHAKQPDEWVTSDGDDWGTEWAYVLGEPGVTVYERQWNRNGSHAVGMFGLGASSTEDGGRWVQIATVRYDDEGGLEAAERKAAEASRAAYESQQAGLPESTAGF